MVYLPFFFPCVCSCCYCCHCCSFSIPFLIMMWWVRGLSQSLLGMSCSLASNRRDSLTHTHTYMYMQSFLFLILLPKFQILRISVLYTCMYCVLHMYTCMYMYTYICNAEFRIAMEGYCKLWLLGAYSLAVTGPCLLGAYMVTMNYASFSRMEPSDSSLTLVIVFATRTLDSHMH